MTRRTLTAALALTLSLGATAPALAAPDTTSQVAESTSDATGEAALQEVRELLEARQLPALIDSSDYACSDTPLRAWRADQLAALSPQDQAVVQSLELFVRAEALLFQPEGRQHFGVDGEYTKELDKTFRSLRSFWDIDGSDIDLGAVHGSVLTDEGRMVRLFMALGQPEPQARATFAFIQQQLQSPGLDHGNHPLFSMTAFAHSDAGRTQLGRPDKILVGDGLLEGMEAVGLGDVAPRGILAHEYGHHVQYELDLMDGYNTSPEATRELELEADALAAYYLSHPRGERLRQQRVEAFVRSFGETGDCNFEGNGHHGTPNQRIAAARWGDQLANAKGKKGHILPSETVSDAFRAVLPTILLPDAR